MHAVAVAKRFMATSCKMAQVIKARFYKNELYLTCLSLFLNSYNSIFRKILVYDIMIMSLFIYTNYSFPIFRNIVFNI